MTSSYDRSTTLDGKAARAAGSAIGKQLFGEGRLDYSRPAGDPGLYGPASVAWRVHANPVALAIGGVAAVILELAEPRVRTGVWEHSIFAKDPLTRMRRTGEATMITTYGPREAALARIAMVNRMHERVAGTTPEGLSYTALDPELTDWVHLTAAYGFLNAYHRYVEPLSRADQDRYYAEGAVVGRAFGAPNPPTSVSEVERRMSAMRSGLVSHAIIGEFLAIVAENSPIGLAGRPLQALVVAASIDLLPPEIAADLNLPRSPLRLAAARVTLKSLAAVARRLPGDIPRQAYARMGLAPFEQPQA